MQRYYWGVIVCLVIVFLVLFLWLDLRPGNTTQGVAATAPLVPEFTPQGCQRYQQASTKPRPQALEAYLTEALSAGVPLAGYTAVGPEHRKPAFLLLADHLADIAQLFPQQGDEYRRNLTPLIER